MGIRNTWIKYNKQGIKKCRVVNSAEVQSWWTPSLEKGFFDVRRSNFLLSWRQGPVDSRCSREAHRVGTGDAADGWLQFSSPSCAQKAGQKAPHPLAASVVCVTGQQRQYWDATPVQGEICRWEQKYFLLRLQLFYRHRSAKVPKAFMKFMAWTSKITWIWTDVE